MANKVTKEEVKYIASLAKIDLREDELIKFEKEFNSILNYISQINEVDVSGIEETHNLEMNKDEVLAEDKVKPSKISKENMLKNATNNRNKNGYIRTSKIVGEE